MSLYFNAEEILEIAGIIEKNGVAFYKKAATIVKDTKISDFLNDLAIQEIEHEKFFNSMRQTLSEEEITPTTPDPDDYLSLYLKIIADGNVFDVKKDPSTLLTGRESMEDIFNMAIQAEKDSIVFYIGMKEFVPEHRGKDKIQNIIKEEMKHIILLNQKRKLVINDL